MRSSTFRKNLRVETLLLQIKRSWLRWFGVRGTSDLLVVDPRSAGEIRSHSWPENIWVFCRRSWNLWKSELSSLTCFQPQHHAGKVKGIWMSDWIQRTREPLYFLSWRNCDEWIETCVMIKSLFEGKTTNFNGLKIEPCLMPCHVFYGIDKK